MPGPDKTSPMQAVCCEDWTQPCRALIGQPYFPLHHYFPIQPSTDDLCDCVLGKKTDVSPSVDFKGVLAHDEPMTGAVDIGNW